MAAGTARKPKKTTKADLVRVLNGEGERLMHLDLVGTAEAAEKILLVERARIGKWRRKGILLSDGSRIDFPDPILLVTSSALQKKCKSCSTLYPTGKKKCPNCGSAQADTITDHTKLAASPLWWGDDIRALKKTLERNRPRDEEE